MHDSDKAILILIFLIIVVVACMLNILYNSSYMAIGALALVTPTVGGGKDNYKDNYKDIHKDNYKDTNNNHISRKLIIADNAKFVVDGNNLVHAITGKPHMLPVEFERGLRTLAWSLSNALPNKDIHIVLKNPSKVKKSDSVETLPYFQQLINMSREFPAITFHLAYGTDKKTDKSDHYLKGRDDFLTLYLARHDGYIISQDRFRDFSKFNDIKPFNHFATANGNIIQREKINPRHKLLKTDKPNIGNHIKYRLINKHELLKNPSINNGDIYVDTLGESGYIYLLI